MKGTLSSMSDLAPDARAFQAFLEALRTAFLERDAVLEQLALALLAREHVLLTGPPGTAKSALAHAVLGGIVEEDGEASLFTRQLTEGAVQTDLLGPVDFKVLTETGRTRHILEEGMLGHRYAFLDEIFDGRDMLLRAVLNALHERELKQGPSVERGLLETAVLTSNRFLSEVVARVPELLLAFADRIAFRAFVPSSFARPESRRALLQGALRARTPAVEVTLPRPGSRGSRRCCPRWRSPRRCWALSRGWWTCSSRRWRRTPPVSRGPASSRSGRWCARCGRCGRRWSATPAAVTVRSGRPPRISGRSRSSSPPPVRRETRLEAVIAHTSDPREQVQLSTVRHEQRSFAEALARALAETRAAADAEARALELPTLTTETERLAAGGAPTVVLARALPLLGAIRDRLARSLRAEHRAVLLGLAGQLTRALEAVLREELDEAQLRRAAELLPLLDAPELAAERARLGDRVRHAGAASRVRFLEEARAFAETPPASVEGVSQALEPLTRWSAALSPDDTEAVAARETAAQVAAEALQLLLTGAGAVPGDAAGFARLRASLDRTAERIHRLRPELDLTPVARALALGHVAALGADEPLLPALERLEAAELLSDEVQAALAPRPRHGRGPGRPRWCTAARGGRCALGRGVPPLPGRAQRGGRRRGPRAPQARRGPRRRGHPGRGRRARHLPAPLVRRASRGARHPRPAGGRGRRPSGGWLHWSRAASRRWCSGRGVRRPRRSAILAGSSPAARRAQDLRAGLAALADGFGTFSRALLAARG